MKRRAPGWGWFARRAITAALLAGGFCLLARPAPPQGTGEWDGVMRPEAAEHHQRGVAALQRGDLKTARREFYRALQYTRKAVPVYNSLGELNLAEGEVDKAVTNFRIAIALGPRFAPAYANMGRALERRKDFAGAREFYMAALRLQPDWPEIKQLLAVLPSSPAPAGHPASPEPPPSPDWPAASAPEVCAEWKKALEADPPDWGARHQCGRALLASGDAAAALTELEAVVKARPQDAVARYDLGRALRRLRRVAEAEEAFRQARELDPTLPDPPA
jgi:Flp pilus assembly protein TadD